MPRRALMHEYNPANDDEIDARCREWRSSQKFSNGGELPSVNQCPCGNPGLSEIETNQCALPGERPRDSDDKPLMRGGEALFLLLLLLTVSMCVSVLLSPVSRRRRRERLEREAREKARALRREKKLWDMSVERGVWLTQPDGAVDVCVVDVEAIGDDRSASRSRRRRRRAAAELALLLADAARETRGVGDDGDGDDGDGDDGGDSAGSDSSGFGSDEGSETDAESDDDARTESETAAARDGEPRATPFASVGGPRSPRRAAMVSASVVPTPRAARTGTRRGEVSGSGSASSAAEREDEARARPTSLDLEGLGDDANV